MADKSPKELRREVEDLGGGAQHDPPRIDDVTVEWREAAPEKRPGGMAWNADAEAEDGAGGTVTLAYDFWSAQQQTLDDLGSGEYDLVALVAGYRTGKSVMGARWLLTQALQYPDTRFLAMGQDYTKAADTTYRTLFESLPGERTHIRTSTFNGPEESPLVADYNRQEHRLTLANDSQIVLGSADRWNRYAGDEYGGVWLDEPSHYGEELYDILEMMGSRLTADRGPKVMCWTLTGNGYNAAYHILEKREDADGEALGLRIKLNRASVLDNPYIDAADKERMKRQYAGGGREEQALHGGFSAAQGLVYSNFSRETHVISAAEAERRVNDQWSCYGYDAGWDDPRVLLEIGKTSYDQLVVLSEFYQTRSHVKDAIEWLKANQKPKGMIYCDHEPSDIEKFKSAGWRAKEAEKNVDAGIADVYRRLSSEGNARIQEEEEKKRRTTTSTWRTGDEVHDLAVSSGDGRKKEKEREREDRVGLLVSERAKHTIREFLSYKEEEKQTAAAADHCMDSLRYAIHTSEGSGDGRQEKSRTTKSTWSEPSDPDDHSRSTTSTW